ncbi:hypothetical protein WKI68_12735 [Streptomyces sp. MS1.HAVA.3]|uniref:Alpha/beta hydrolase n=1 Tax=Streptomyces caledonius TaxID=3134107 RepID=A0ABU8U2J8_9ACTN
MLQRTVGGAAHFPWVENPSGARTAFADLTGLLRSRPPRPVG